MFKWVGFNEQFWLIATRSHFMPFMNIIPTIQLHSAKDNSTSATGV